MGPILFSLRIYMCMKNLKTFDQLNEANNKSSKKFIVGEELSADDIKQQVENFL